MKRGTKDAWTNRRTAVLVLLAALLVLAAACPLLNKSPTALFSVGPSTTGQAPFEVTLSAAVSYDPDGEIKTYEWDYGDGGQGTGKSVSHTYTAAGTYTVVLVVTDDNGADDRVQKVITVLPGEPPGPTASFTASPTSGPSPLSVRFDASGSSYDQAPLFYSWDFGDGRTGSGKITTHLYVSSSASTYTVTLTVRGPDNKVGTATASISITGPGGGGGTPAAGAPSARFDIVDDTTIVGGPAGSIGVAPYNALFDPQDTEAAVGKTLAQLVWSFGDADSTSTPNLVQQWHAYVTDDPSEVFSVTLLVMDNEADTDTITKTVKVYNHQPVAGFEICNPLGGHTAADDDEEYANEAAAIAANRWDDDDNDDGVIMGDLQHLAAANANVFIRSMITTDVDWYNLADTGDQDTLAMAEGILAAPGTVPGVPDDYVAADDAFSYDPEGQDWTTALPAWFGGNPSWGIQWIYVDWDDGPEEQFDYAAETTNYTADAVMMHPYAYPGGSMTKTITIRVVDFLGAEAEFSRTLYFMQGTEAVDDL